MKTVSKKTAKKSGRAVKKVVANADAAKTKLEGLATEIQAGHRLCMEALKGVIAQAKVIGSTLIEAKKLVKHGRWLAWVEQNCRFDPRMAQNYMLVAAHYTGVVAAFKTADEWRLTEFIAVARELEAARRGKSGKKSPAAKPGPFQATAGEIDRRRRLILSADLRPAVERVQEEVSVADFVREKLAALYAAVRRLARSKDAGGLAADGLDAADLGIIVVESLRAALDPAALFAATPAPAVPAVPVEPSIKPPINRLKRHLGNGKAHGPLPV